MPQLSKPKYLLIRDEIKNKILDETYKVGKKIPSESALKTKYKVSRHTIRQAISELVSEGFLLKRQGSGTYVSEDYLQEEVEKSKTIGVITTYVSDYIFPSIIRGIEEELSQKQYSLMLSSTHNNVNNERNNLESMLQQNVDGLIIEPTKSSLLNPNLNYYLKILQEDIPLLMLHAKYEELDASVIAMNDFKAGEIATEHLIDLNHKRIAIITKADDAQGKKRLKGYISAHHKNNLNFKNSHLIPYETETIGKIPKRMREILSESSNPTAFVCYNDEISILLIRELLAMEKSVPDDFSIVSIDNSQLSDILPSIRLTSVNHPKEKMGRVAAEWIVNAIENGNGDKNPIIFEPDLIIGNSTKKLVNNRIEEND